VHQQICPGTSDLLCIIGLKARISEKAAQKDNPQGTRNVICV
jgi:hypothetical protein